MSITFSIQGRETDFDARFGEPGGWWMNLANDNARSLLNWIGYGDVDLWSGANTLYAPHVAAQCKERLRLTPGNVDRARQGHESGGPGTGQCRFIEFERPEGYLMDRVEQLLRLAEEAGAGFIVLG